MANLLNNLRNSPYINLIPEYLKENEDFLVFLSMLIHEFDITNENIRKYPDIINPDRVPINLIEALGSYFNYRYLVNATDDFNREVLMRMRSIWEQRGTEHSIIMAATHGDNDGWVGGDIFIPNYPISKNTAKLLIPRNSIFIHNRSKFSGSDVYAQGGLYTQGVLLLRVPYWDERVRQRVYDNTPAGLKYIIEIMSEFFPTTDDVGEFGELSFFKWLRVWPKTDEEKLSDNSDIECLYLRDLKCIDEDLENILIHSDKKAGILSDNNYFSGRLGVGKNSIIIDDEITLSGGVSILPLKALCKPFGTVPTTGVLGPDDNIFIHNESDFSGKDVYPSKSNLIIKDVADDSKYIISPSGEYLDTKEKDTADHILERDLNYQFGEFNTYGEDPNLGLIEFSRQGEKDILPSDVLYYVPYVNDKHPWDYRDPFYQPEAEIYFEQIIPKDKMFVHNVSVHSGRGRFPSSGMFDGTDVYPPVLPDDPDKPPVLPDEPEIPEGNYISHNESPHSGNDKFMSEEIYGNLNKDNETT